MSTPNNTRMSLPDGALVVRPTRARELLGGMGRAQFYELLNAGEFESYAEGAARLITVESIFRYIAKRLAASQPPAKAPARPTSPSPGRPRTRRAAPTASPQATT